MSAPVDPHDTGTTVLRATVDDVDRYTAVVAGISLEVIRSGVGHGPNDIRSVTDGRINLNAPSVGFPNLVRSEVSEENLSLAFFDTAPDGTKFGEFDMRPNDILYYGPGTEHTSTDPPGLRFKYAVIRRDDVHERADAMGVRLGDIDSGRMSRVLPHPGLLRVRRLITDAFDVPATHSPPGWLLDEVLTSVAGAMVKPRSQGGRRTRGVLDNGRIVRRSVEFAAQLGRRPIVHELCQLNAVSERSLRNAFVDVYEVPPSVYFRLWALDEANRRLRTEPRTTDSVTRIALDVGFSHLGRFSEYYRHVYGELPSETLRSSGPRH